MRAVSYPYNDRTKSYRAITVERDVVSWTDFHLHFFSVDFFLMKQENCKSTKNLYVALQCILLYKNIHSSDIFTLKKKLIKTESKLIFHTRECDESKSWPLHLSEWL